MSGTGHGAAAPALLHAYQEETHRYVTPSDLTPPTLEQDLKFASYLSLIPNPSSKCEVPRKHLSPSSVRSTFHGLPAGLESLTYH